MLALARRATSAGNAFGAGRTLVGGAAIVGLAVVLISLDPLVAIPASLSTAILLAGFGRRLGAFHGLGALVPLFGSTPGFLARPTVGFISWLDPTAASGRPAAEN
jgi:hypothetical protein